MATKQVEPDLDPQREQEQRPRKATRNQKVGAFLAAAAIGLGAVAFMLATRGEEDATTPADQSPAVAPGTATGPFFLDLETGEKTPLAENLAGGFNYAGSPDGTKLAYGTCCSGADVMTVANVDGTDARTLESPEGLNFYGARWSPDGTKLVYQERDGGGDTPRGDTPRTGDVGNLFIEDLSSGRRTQLTHLQLKRAWWWFLSPSFSPDGRSVIFHLPRSKSEVTKWDVWSVPVTGGDPTLVLRNALFPMLRPEGPEGERIAFVSPMAADLAGHRIMTGRPTPESDLRQTLVKANDTIWWATMSPDGSRIAYRDGGSIYVVDVSTGESSKVAEGSVPEWLDADTLIVYP
jgi:Tol biopolymer transport system component